MAVDPGMLLPFSFAASDPGGLDLGSGKINYWVGTGTKSQVSADALPFLDPLSLIFPGAVATGFAGLVPVPSDAANQILYVQPEVANNVGIVTLGPAVSYPISTLARSYLGTETIDVGADPVTTHAWDLTGTVAGGRTPLVIVNDNAQARDLYLYIIGPAGFKISGGTTTLMQADGSYANDIPSITVQKGGDFVNRLEQTLYGAAESASTAAAGTFAATAILNAAPGPGTAANLGATGIAALVAFSSSVIVSSVLPQLDITDANNVDVGVVTVVIPNAQPSQAYGLELVVPSLDFTVNSFVVLASPGGNLFQTGPFSYNYLGGQAAELPLTQNLSSQPTQYSVSFQKQSPLCIIISGPALPPNGTAPGYIPVITTPLGSAIPGSQMVSVQWDSSKALTVMPLQLESDVLNAAPGLTQSGLTAALQVSMADSINQMIATDPALAGLQNVGYAVDPSDIDITQSGQTIVVGATFLANFLTEAQNNGVTLEAADAGLKTAVAAGAQQMQQQLQNALNLPNLTLAESLGSAVFSVPFQIGWDLVANVYTDQAIGAAKTQRYDYYYFGTDSTPGTYTISLQAQAAGPLVQTSFLDSISEYHVFVNQRVASSDAPPQFQVGSLAVQVPVGTTSTVALNVQGSPAPQLTMTPFGTNQIPSDVTLNQNQGTLTFSPPSTELPGTQIFYVIADNDRGQSVLLEVDYVVTSGSPVLYIAQSGDMITVSWASVPGWSLQQNSNLAAPSGWTLSSGVTTSNGTNYLNLASPAGTLFFRLTQQ
jgi:hypothetical protein